MAKRGRPRKYSEVEILQNKIDSYFADCPDKRRLNIVDKLGELHTIEIATPTMTGLALFLGFVDRRSLYEYEENPKFTHTIKKARLRIENEYEKQLWNDKCTGAIFALKNFGWKDKVENEITTKVPIIEDNINGET